MNNDNFDNLWDKLKEQVRAARGDREAIYTNGESPFSQRNGARVSVDPYEEENFNVSVSVRRASVQFAATPADLLTIAAKCIAAAIDSTDEHAS